VKLQIVDFRLQIVFHIVSHLKFNLQSEMIWSLQSAIS